MPRSIRWRFITFISLAVFLGCCITALWTTYHIRQETELIAIEKVKTNSALAEALLDSRFPGSWEVRDEKLYKGNTLIDENFFFIDEVERLTGDTCSIFLGDTRVATTIAHNGQRAVGTKLSPEVAQIVLKDGRELLGEDNVVGVKLQTVYRPIRNDLSQIIGVWYVGANKNFADTIIQNTLRQVGLAFLLGWLIIVSIIWLLTSSLIQPLAALGKAADRLAAGDLDTEIVIHAKDEIGFLAQAFEQMRKKLRVTNQTLESLVNERTAELKQAYAELKQLDELKSSFLSTVSHELRTPLTSILGFAKIIQKKLDDVVFPQVAASDRRIIKTMQQITSNINIIITEGDRLTNLINDVLDLAKMESGKVEWKTEPLSIPDLLERAIKTSESLWSQKNNLTVSMDIPNKLPMVTGDYDRLLQVMLNLISNAVKFTEVGSIVCRAKHIGDQLIVSVTDTGIGITPESQEVIFDKFKQIGDTLTEKPNGTGLGLPICKQIIEYHGGNIWVTSKPGVGSTFFFSLPVPTQSSPINSSENVDTQISRIKPPAPATKNNQRKTKTILIVDDDPSIQTLLVQELEGVGYQVIAVSDGLQALDTVYSAINHDGTIPDLIVLDVMMPKMSGFDVAAAFKTNPATMHIPIVILSVLEDQQRASLIGVDRYLTKPVNMDLLLHEVTSLLTLDNSYKNIVVVNDDRAILQHLAAAFTASGFAVFSTADSRESIKRAMLQKQGVIIIGSRMSEQYDMLQSLRQEQGFENVHFFHLAKLSPNEDSG